jgi:hypothetical protein
MAEYRLLTTWHIEAPLEAVYLAIYGLDQFGLTSLFPWFSGTPIAH